MLGVLLSSVLGGGLPLITKLGTTFLQQRQDKADKAQELELMRLEAQLAREGTAANLQQQERIANMELQRAMAQTDSEIRTETVKADYKEGLRASQWVINFKQIVRPLMIVLLWLDIMLIGGGIFYMAGRFPDQFEALLLLDARTGGYLIKVVEGVLMAFAASISYYYGSRFAEKLDGKA